MLGQHLNVAVCAYADMEPDQDAFTIRGDWHAPGSPSIVGHYSLASFGQLALQRLHAGLPLILEDIAGELPVHEAKTFLSIGLAATICMPLVKSGRLTALMAIHQQLPRVWCSYELALLAEVTERSWAHIERVRAEVRRRGSEERFRNDLEAQVQERTEALRISEANSRRTEQALHQAQKMEALGKLTGGVAHDFNNLLMAVMGSLELLNRRMPANPPLNRLLDNARTGAQRGATLVARMLAFARQQDLQMQSVELVTLIKGMSELLQRSLGPTVELEIHMAAESAWVLSDPNQLESALLNLALNARDAMHGQGTITIGTDLLTVKTPDASLKTGGYWRISVTDTGEGMDEDTLRRAIEPFFTTKGIGQGTGLGLSMVHGIVEQSGGTLRLHSKIGQGSTIELWLPEIPAPIQSNDDHTSDSGRGQAKIPTLQILVVDDDPLVLTNTEEMLRDEGHYVRSVTNGRSALEFLEQQHFDVMITDHAMPSMAGAQLVKLAAEKHPSVQSILVSGYAEIAPDQIPEVPRLAKPYSQQQLLDLVEKVLKNSRAE